MMKTDAVIVGGGVVGALAALCLKPIFKKVILIEKRTLAQVQQAQFSRTIALNHKSIQFLQTLGLWSACLAFSCPITQVQISMSSQWTTSRLKAQELGCDFLGYVIPLYQLEKVIYQALFEQGVEIAEQTELLGMAKLDSGWCLNLKHQDTFEDLEAFLCIGADGQNSQVRNELGIGSQTRQYDQAAWMGIVDLVHPHENMALEHFTQGGAIALLPMIGQQATFVWTMNAYKAKSLSSLSDEAFLSQLTQDFPRLEHQIKKQTIRVLVPLNEIKADQQVAEQAVLIGNAAHSLHPIAAQGLNLTLRDLKSLKSHLCTNQSVQEALHAYEMSREPDQRQIMQFTHALSQHVASSQWPLGLKHLGLVLFEVLNPLKNHISRMNLGALS